jgi:hypothetical protein
MNNIYNINNNWSDRRFGLRGRHGPTKDFIGRIWRDPEFSAAQVSTPHVQIISCVDMTTNLATFLVTDGVYFMPAYMVGEARNQLRREPLPSCTVIRITSWRRRSPPYRRAIVVKGFVPLTTYPCLYGDQVPVPPTRDFAGNL